MDIKTSIYWGIGNRRRSAGLYLYYDSQRNQVKVDLPGVKIESH